MVPATFYGGAPLAGGSIVLRDRDGKSEGGAMRLHRANNGQDPVLVCFLQ